MFYAILFNMDLPRAFWPDWVASLRKNQLDSWLAWLLDAAGPFNLIGAQLVYLATPLLGDSPQSKALAALLEDDTETRAFITLLREKS
jgi:hypothetical protein